MKLRESIKKILRKDENARRLAGVADVAQSTIYRWIRENHKNLGRREVLEEIERITGCTVEDILEEETPHVQQESSK